MFSVTIARTFLPAHSDQNASPPGSATTTASGWSLNRFRVVVVGQLAAHAELQRSGIVDAFGMTCRTFMRVRT
ncbi:hypothetical protein [Halolamina sediminis]|jgi:hypothetical protein|uniref:hypothetical protein n=1 Tax=Halolamina sediminis TaxID=1480675 RepID=UPI0006B5FAEF|nr:hypothetical protein [Halolamina sediminis]